MVHLLMYSTLGGMLIVICTVYFSSLWKFWKINHIFNWFLCSFVSKTIFVILPQLETFLSMYYSLVLLIKTINTYMLSVYGVIFHLFQEMLTKKNWLRLRWLRQRLAEAETEITHVARTLFGTWLDLFEFLSRLLWTNSSFLFDHV